MKKIFTTLLVLYTQQLTANNLIVPITDNLASFETVDSGHKIKVERIQDFNNKLVDDFTKTSRACPPFCIQPTNIQNLKTIAELEVIDFIRTKVKENKGLIIDTRLRSWFELETIPSAINIPFSLMETNKADKILKLLGTVTKSNGKKDFTKVKELVLFSNGAWSAQSSKFISAILAKGYPKDKIMSYRDGLQGWKLLGLTTVIHKEIK
jgi:rhodanese-related sulfurtransferase